MEGGGTTYKNNQDLYSGNDPKNTAGMRPAPYFGQTIDLTSLAAAYGIRGTSVRGKGLFTANPVSWMDLYGQFLFSQPSSTVNYQQYDTGNLVLQTQLLFYSAQQYLVDLDRADAAHLG